MKKFLIALSAFFLIAVSANKADAQISSTDLLGAAQNLVNVQVGAVNVNVVDVVDVSDVLNDNTVIVTALNNILTGITIDKVLTNVLKDAEIITGNMVVVGVVVDVLGETTQVLVAEKKALKQK
jgi:hypothetical protein